MVKKYSLTVGLLWLVLPVCAQQEARNLVRSGLRLYADSLYTKAEVDFRKAIDLSSTFALAHYNLAASLMRENNLEEGLKEMEVAAKGFVNPYRKAKAYHNIGVILQASEKYQEAIEAYKESLRNNPDDDGTRYNLALCQYLLKNNPQDNDQQNQDQQNEGQDKTDEEKKDSDKENQSKDDSQQDQNKEEEQKQQQQPQNNMSQENAEQLLKAAMQDEKDVQDRMNRQQKSGQKRRLEKQW
ncbi:MAG: tetratricopeptide repeat protein [Clostridium sp.]|nr:tetratricopeptide repeat protein [Clostridium sp.]